MKNFVIYLPTYQSSVDMAHRAIESGQQHGWNIQLWPGVNGMITAWTDIQPCVLDAKCREMLDRPGVRGCFLSHWSLWNLCVDLNECIGIFEHDIIFNAEPVAEDFSEILKLEGFLKKKSRPAGEWYEGARAYLIKPTGAKKLITWADKFGALPADVAIGLDVVDIKLSKQRCVKQHELYGKTDKRNKSFTWNLEGMT